MSGSLRPDPATLPNDARRLPHPAGVLTKEVIAATGASYRQLDYWDRTGVVVPVVEAKGSGTVRRYSPADVARVRLVVGLLAAGTDLSGARGALACWRAHPDVDCLVFDGHGWFGVDNGEEIVELLDNADGPCLVVPLAALVSEAAQIAAGGAVGGTAPQPAPDINEGGE